MPLLPTFDVSGISSLFAIILISLSFVWGLNKAILTVK